RGTLLHAPDMYMMKMAVGKRAAGKINLFDPVDKMIEVVAKANNKRVQDVTVIIQERERHQDIIDTVREKGARVKLFGDGDVGAAIAACLPHTGIDLFLGIGGAPEGVISAAAIKCLGGDMQAMLKPQNDSERERCIKMGLANPEQLLTLHDMVKGDDAIFAATGVSDGELLQGVRYLGDDMVETHSIVMRAQTKTIRFVRALHNIEHKPNLAWK
ncbi:fructose-bisphosphatase class II, partial [Brevibacillus agri]